MNKEAIDEIELNLNEIVKKGETTFWYWDLDDCDEIEISVQNEGGCIASIETTNMKDRIVTDRTFVSSEILDGEEKEFYTGVIKNDQATGIRVKVVNTSEDRVLFIRVKKYRNLEVINPCVQCGKEMEEVGSLPINFHTCYNEKCTNYNLLQL